MNISPQTAPSLPGTYLSMSATQVDGLMAGPGKFIAGFVSMLRNLFVGQPSVKSDIERVRDMADSFVRTDPGYASDLYAAADRAERELLGEG